MFAPQLRPMLTAETIQAAWAAELGRRGRSPRSALDLADVRVGDKRVFVRQGKGGHQRLVPVSVSVSG